MRITVFLGLIGLMAGASLTAIKRWWSTSKALERTGTGLFTLATVFAYPSLWEGFGLPVLEAMTCGTPVLTSDISSLPEVAGAAAVLVPPTDVEAIADGLLRLLEDAALRADLAECGRRQAANFSWERCARETLSVYNSVLR
jgi:glycosyltransferase involved in cell wall biosynthesis